MKTAKTLLISSLLAFTILSGCDDQGDERMLEKARLEGREQAKGELEAQIANKESLLERARAEGRAQAEAELKVQLENKDALIQKARNEGRAVAEQGIAAQNEMLKARAAGMERDLSKRHRFYQSLSGTYQGDLETEAGTYRIKITLAPTITPYPVERMRLPEEIANDLNLLSFSAQIVEWNPANPLSAVGCRVENLRPDLSRGVITISKEACGSVYSLAISDSRVAGTTSKGKVLTSAERSKATAAQVLSGKITSISDIRGLKRPTTNAQEYPFTLRKSE